MKRLAYILVAISLMVGLVGVAGCGGGTVTSPHEGGEAGEGQSQSQAKAEIREVISSYFEAYNSGNYDECLGYYSSMVKQQKGEDSIKSSLAFSHELTGKIDFEIQQITISGSNAEVKSLISCDTGTEMKTIPLIKENNSWKLSKF